MRIKRNFYHFNIGTALNQLGEITNVLREKTRLGGSNEHNKKQYQEYRNTVANQNAGNKMNRFHLEQG